MFTFQHYSNFETMSEEPIDKKKQQQEEMKEHFKKPGFIAALVCGISLVLLPIFSISGYTVNLFDLIGSSGGWIQKGFLFGAVGTAFAYLAAIINEGKEDKKG